MESQSNSINIDWVSSELADSYLWMRARDGPGLFYLQGQRPKRLVQCNYFWSSLENMVFATQHLNCSKGIGKTMHLLCCVNSVIFNSYSLKLLFFLAEPLRDYLADGCWSLSAKSCQSRGTSGPAMFHKGSPTILEQWGWWSSRVKFKNKKQTQIQSWFLYLTCSQKLLKWLLLFNDSNITRTMTFSFL